MPLGWSGHPSPGPRDCHAVKASCPPQALTLVIDKPGVKQASLYAKEVQVRQAWLSLSMPR